MNPVLNRNVLPTLVTLLVASVAFADSPVGTWSWTHPDQNGQGSSTDQIVIVDEDGKLSGKYKSEQGELDLEKLKQDGNKLAFEINFGQTLAFMGEVKGDKYSGTANMTNVGAFPFEATRKSKVDGTGVWRWEYQDPASGENVKGSATIKDEDGKLSGMFGSPQGELPMAVVKMEGKKLTFGIDFEGTKVTWAGDVKGDDISGTVAGDFGEFPWAAKRDAKK